MDDLSFSWKHRGRVVQIYLFSEIFKNYSSVLSETIKIKPHQVTWRWGNSTHSASSQPNSLKFTSIGYVWSPTRLFVCVVTPCTSNAWCFPTQHNARHLFILQMVQPYKSRSSYPYIHTFLQSLLISSPLILRFFTTTAKILYSDFIWKKK